MLTLETKPRPWQAITADLMGYSPRTIIKGRGKNRHELLDMVVGFDIETTSITVRAPRTKRKMVKGDATIDPGAATWNVGVSRETTYIDAPNDIAAGAVMYAWVVAVNGRAYVGRTWEEFDEFRHRLNESLDAGPKRHLMVWVHNLAFEFQFIRRRLQWSRVFAIKDREVVSADTYDGWEFRCSFKLTLASLKYVASDMLHEHKIKKLTGDLDYDKPRGPWTPLTSHEWAYIVHDGLILNALIDERRKEDGGLDKIPLTKTSYVRQECREVCYRVKGYSEWVHGLTLSPTQYKQLSLVKAGGFTHASPWLADMILYDVISFDIGSSYPTVMCCEMFPMSNFESDPGVERMPDLDAYKSYLWYARFTFYDVENTENSDITLSRSKCAFPCDENGKPTVRIDEANGRILKAERLTTWFTNVDLDVFLDFYKCDMSRTEIAYLHWSVPGYLPRALVDQILKYYHDKTKLKGNDGPDAIRYARSKERINSVFGMMLTDPIRDEVKYFNGDPAEAVWTGWSTRAADIDEAIDKYNKDRNRFIWWPWGIWVTAYARRNVTRAIKAIGGDYIYCDTDSVKFRNPEAHQAFFDAYNEQIAAKMEKAMAFHGFDPKRAAPLDSKDIARPLGYFEFDGRYRRFKTLGAKRYMYESLDSTNDGTDGLAWYIHTTVAGCGKRGLVKYLETMAEPFAAFRDNLTVPSDYTEKMTHTYGDNRIEGELVDYLGNSGNYDEWSWVHLGPCEYHIGVNDEFLWWINKFGQPCVNIEGPGGEC